MRVFRRTNSRLPGNPGRPSGEFLGDAVRPRGKDEFPVAGRREGRDVTVDLGRDPGDWGDDDRRQSSQRDDLLRDLGVDPLRWGAGAFDAWLDEYGDIDAGSGIGGAGIAGFTPDSYREGLGNTLGLLSDSGGYGSAGTPTPIEIPIASGDPLTGELLPLHGATPEDSGNGGTLAISGNASSTTVDASTGLKSDWAIGGVLTVPFGSAPATAKPGGDDGKKNTDRGDSYNSKRDVNPRAKNPSAVEQGVDAPKKKPGTGTGRANPMDERPRVSGPIDSITRRRLRAFTPPNYTSNVAEKHRGDARVFVDWDLLVGGGFTDPSPIGDSGLRRPRRPAASAGFKWNRPASDDPNIFGSLASLAFAGEAIDDDSE